MKWSAAGPGRSRDHDITGSLPNHSRSCRRYDGIACAAVLPTQLVHIPNSTYQTRVEHHLIGQYRGHVVSGVGLGLVGKSLSLFLSSEVQVLEIFRGLSTCRLT